MLYYFFQILPILLNELGLKQQILWRIACYSQFGESQQINAKRLCFINEMYYLICVAAQVTHSRVNLSHSQSQDAQLVSFCLDNYLIPY